MNIDPSHEAKAYVSLLWQHIYTRVRSMLHPHAREHGPGGNDPLEIPLGFLSDVYVTGAGNGDALTYESATKHWIPGAGAGGAGQAFFEATGTVAAGTTPGPTNLTGAALTITRVYVASDGVCEGTAAGQAFAFSAGGGTEDHTGLTTPWGDASAISATINPSPTPTATYLTVDVYFTS